MWFRKSCFCRQNVEWNALRILPFSRFLRKRSSELVERVARETAIREAPKQCGCDPLPLEHRTSSSEFRLKAFHCVGDRLGLDRASSEIGADRGIAVAASRKQLGAAHRDAGIVEEPGSVEGRDRLLACRGGMSRLHESLLERLPRAGARGQGPSRG